jgi:hypothetical protein
MCVSKKYFTSLFIVFLTIVSLIVLDYFKFSFKNEASLSRNFKNLHDGDLILRCGRSTESFAVYLADSNSEFTHIGIISIENNIPYVIHAVPSETNLILKEKLTSFINSKNCSKFAIYRANLKDGTLTTVALEAQKIFNSKYTFDNRYDLNTNNKLYCTELVLKSFKNAGIKLQLTTKELNYVIGKQAIIFPSEFTKPPLFYKIF